MVLLLLLSGCRTQDNFNTNDGFVSPLKPADITYAELAKQYNAAIEPLSTLWTRADIEIAWAETNQDGERKIRSESGNGKFIMRRGQGLTETAMTVEKVGKIYLWVGANQTQYYLFDRVDGDNKTLYLGTHPHLIAVDSQPKTQPKPFPLPIHPNAVPALLGLKPLPVGQAFADEDVTVDRYQEQYQLSLPSQRVRMLIDPATFRPTRVDLTDAKGFSVITSKLSGRLSVEDAVKTGHTPPMICRKAEVYVAGYESRFTLDFESATANTRKVRDRMFDLDTLKKALKPDRVMDLDAP